MKIIEIPVAVASFRTDSPTRDTRRSSQQRHASPGAAVVDNSLSQSRPCSGWSALLVLLLLLSSYRLFQLVALRPSDGEVCTDTKEAGRGQDDISRNRGGKGEFVVWVHHEARRRAGQHG